MEKWCRPGRHMLTVYDIARKLGFDGTEREFIEWLRGPSAYQVAVALGYKGTESEWLESLRGDDGASAYDVAKEYGFEGSVEEWLLSLKGKDGKTAYESAQATGFEGTEEEWLLSLHGKNGDPGESAYEIAVKNGFEGDESAWLLSLKGKDAYQTALDQGFEGSYDDWLNQMGVTVDDELSDTSLNPVQNRIITLANAMLDTRLTNHISANEENVHVSATERETWSGKQDKIGAYSVAQIVAALDWVMVQMNETPPVEPEEPDEPEEPEIPEGYMQVKVVNNLADAGTFSYGTDEVRIEAGNEETFTVELGSTCVFIVDSVTEYGESAVSVTTGIDVEYAKVPPQYIYDSYAFTMPLTATEAAYAIIFGS